MNDPTWIKFRDTVCHSHKSTHGPYVDACCTVDQDGNVVCFHGDCVQENCPADWKKFVEEKLCELK